MYLLADGQSDIFFFYKSRLIISTILSSTKLLMFLNQKSYMYSSVNNNWRSSYELLGKEVFQIYIHVYYIF